MHGVKYMAELGFLSQSFWFVRHILPEVLLYFRSERGELQRPSSECSSLSIQIPVTQYPALS